MNKFLAAIAATLVINVFAGVQVTKQYCDNNSERAVSNSYQLVKVEAAKLPGIASNITASITPQIITNKVDEVMRSESVKIIITNTIHNTIMNEPVVSNAVSAAAYDAAGKYTDQASNYVNIASTYAASSAASSESARIRANNAYSSEVQAGNSAQSARSWSETSRSYSESSHSAYNDIVVFTNWFELHKGQVVTNHNIYVAEDQVARAGVAQNANDIASLEGRVGDNIQQLTTRMGTAETNIGNLNTSVSGLTTRMGTAETNIGNLNTSVSKSFAYTTAVSNKLEQFKVDVGNSLSDLTNMLTKIGGQYTYELQFSTYTVYERVSVNSMVYNETTYDGYQIYDYPFSVSVLTQHDYSPWIKKIYKRKQTNELCFRFVKGSNGSTLIFQSSNDPKVLTVGPGRSYLSSPFGAYWVSFEPPRYADSIGMEQFNSFSNWVERTFQKK